MPGDGRAAVVVALAVTLLSALGYGLVTNFATSFAEAAALLAKRVPEGRRASLISQQQNAVDVGIGISGLLFGALIVATGAPVLFALAGLFLVVVPLALAILATRGSTVAA